MRIGVALRGALEIGVGEIIEGDDLLEVEQGALLRVQEPLQRHLVLEQLIGDPIQRLQLEPQEIVVDQLAQRALVLQPAEGGKLAAGSGHARDQGGDGRRPLRPVEAQGFELPIQPDLAQRRQGHMLDRHAAWTQQLKAVDIDRVIIRPGARAAFIHAGPGADQLRRIALRRLFPLRIQIRGHQILLSANQVLDTLHQSAPLRARYVEVPTQVQQRALAYPPALADRLHQAVGVVGLARLSALDRGTADIHVATVASPAGNSNGDIDDYGTTFGIRAAEVMNFNRLLHVDAAI